MTRSEHIRILLEEYAHQRAANEEALNFRIKQVCRIDPKIAELRKESASLALNTMRSILSYQTHEERAAAAEAMKKRGQEINKEIRERLKRAGLSEHTLDMQYRCKLCRDTGYVGDAPARFCDCFAIRLRFRQHEDGTMAGLDEQNFSKFDENVIPEADGQRAQMLQARKLCEEYANTFPETRYRNLLLTGTGGLGKTFLLNCVCEKVLARGYSAVRITSFRMFEAMRQQHMGNDESFTGFSSLIEAPLLLIDDLGTEPMMRNITVEYFFTLLNERAAAKRHTVFATNLNPVQLQERYGERVASRLLDKTCCAPILLKGKDLRTL